MMEKTEADGIAENLIKAFVQFKRLRMEDSSPKFGSDHTHHGLKHSEIMLLNELKEVENEYPDGISVSDISRSLCVKPPSITPIITGLEQKNMIERTMDRNDRRIIRVKMTEKGNQFIKMSRKHMVEQIRGLVDYLGEEKSRSLANLINEVFVYFIEHKTQQNKQP